MAVISLEVTLLHQVGDDFGIGFGGELVPFFNQLLLKRDVVFDDPVVHHDNAPGAVPMGMRVLFSGTAVRGPAGMTDSVGAIQRLETNYFFQVTQLAFGPANL